MFKYSRILMFRCLDVYAKLIADYVAVVNLRAAINRLLGLFNLDVALP